MSLRFVAMMTILSNPGFLVVAYMECSAACLLLILYWLLLPGYRARFFRIWILAWTVYAGLECVRVAATWLGGQDQSTLATLISPLVAILILATATECAGKGPVHRYLWPSAVMAESGLSALQWVAHMPRVAQWSSAILVSALYVAAGWIFWRTQARHRGAGWKLLAAVLLLRGLHGLDRPLWMSQELGLLRSSFHGLLGIAMGGAMAVLVLEEGRARAEDLSDHLRRLALVSAEAMQAAGSGDALRRILSDVLDCLGAAHGLVLLLDNSDRPARFSIRGRIGFSDTERNLLDRVSRGEPWVERVLGSPGPVTVHSSSDDRVLRQWLDSEQLSTMLLVRIPGKDAPLGLLAIGSSEPRTYQPEEEHYLMNLANLLGLTVQNLALIESVSSSHRQWEDTFDSIDDLVLVHDSDGKILNVNRALAARLQARPQDLAGRMVREVLRPGNTPWKRCPYCESAAAEAEKFDPSFGGYYLSTVSALHDSGGSRLGTIHVLRDVTTRRQAENKFRTLFEKVQEGVFISAPDGRFVDFNNAFMRILGYGTPAELIAADPSSIYVDPADRERRQRLLREYGEIADFEFRFRRCDGEVRIGHESSFAARDESGAVIAYQGFLLDITDLKNAEADVRRRNQELLALNTIADLLGESSALKDSLRAVLLRITELFTLDVGAVFFLDQNATHLVNPVLVGFRSEAARRIDQIEMSPALLDQLRRVHATIFSGASPVLPESFHELRSSEGLHASQIAVLWSKDRIMGLLLMGCRETREFSAAELNLFSAVANQIATTIDKSLLLEQSRDAYESLRRTQQQLLQSEKMAAVGQLISGVAHELNNPLTAILGYSEMLRSDGLSRDQASEYAEKLHRQAQRTHHIVQSLLSFARQRKPHRSAVNLHQILEDTLVLREYDLRIKKIRVHRQFDPHLPDTSADFHQLQQVFLNVLNNAVDAIEESGGPGEIWIRTEASHGRLRVEFTDSGPGIKNPNRIFDPFYTTKPVGKGTGLGLSICYGIVKEHGGEIEARNSPPRGATFVITLPVMVGGSSPVNDDASNPKGAIRGTILLVDDVETVLQLEEEVLEAAGASVLLARTAAQAIEILTRETVDAVICDARLYWDDSGTGLCGWIGKHQPGLSPKILFTVSSAGEEDMSRLLRSTGCPILCKPFHIDQFLAAVNSVLSTPAPSHARI